MFWNRFCELCEMQNKKPNAVAHELGFGSSVVTHWKKGTQPNPISRAALAKYFGVSVEYLMGESDNPSKGTEQLDEQYLSIHEQRLIQAYRSQPALRSAVDRILGIELDGYVRIYAAAKSEGNHPEQILYMRRDRWEELKNTKDTDIVLM